MLAVVVLVWVVDLGSSSRIEQVVFAACRNWELFLGRVNELRPYPCKSLDISGKDAHSVEQISRPEDTFQADETVRRSLAVKTLNASRMSDRATSVGTNGEVEPVISCCGCGASSAG